MKNCLHTDCQQSTYAGCLHETMGNGINISDNTGPICANCGKLGHMGCTGVTNKPTWEQKIAAYGFLGTNLRSHDETKQFILDLLAEQRKETEDKINNWAKTVEAFEWINGKPLFTQKQVFDLIDLLKQ